MADQWEAQWRLTNALRAHSPESVEKALRDGADATALVPSQPNRSDLHLLPVQMLASTVKVSRSYANGGRGEYADVGRTLLRLLLDAGADINGASLKETLSAVERYHRSDLAPLALAAEHAPVEFVEALLTAGANVYQQSAANREQVFHVAARRLGKYLGDAAADGVSPADEDALSVYQLLQATVPPNAFSAPTEAGASCFSLLVESIGERAGSYAYGGFWRNILRKPEGDQPLPFYFTLKIKALRASHADLIREAETRLARAVREAARVSVEWGTASAAHHPRRATVYVDAIDREATVEALRREAEALRLEYAAAGKLKPSALAVKIDAMTGAKIVREADGDLRLTVGREETVLVMAGPQRGRAAEGLAAA